MACPLASTLGALLSDTLPPDQVAELDGHLRACPQCRGELDRLSGRPAPTFVDPDDPLLREPDLDHLVERLGSSGWLDVPAGEGGPEPGLAQPGRVGPYRIEGEIGRGAMGIVYRARDEALGRLVALKVFTRPGVDGQPDPRFLREAQAVARVRHDHVVAVHAIHQPPDGLAGLVMELIDGDSLKDILARDRALPPRVAAEFAAQVADGLAAAHAAGLVHRDVKPSNILVERSTGRAKLVDFGLVRVAAAAGLTHEGTLVGTPAYMSPEQVSAPDRVDARTDVYGLGTTLYELLTGVAPFHGPVELVLRQVTSDDPIPPRRLNPAIPKDLETIALKAMARDLGRRYPAAIDLRDDLRRYLNGEPIRARPIGPLGRAWQWRRRNPRVAVLAGLVAVLLVAVSIGSAVAAVLSRRAEARAEADRKAADEARNEADASARAARADFELAFEALDMLITTTQQQLGSQPGLLPLKRQLLETAAAGLQRLVHGQEDLGRVDRLVVAAHDRLGAVYFDLGRTPEARAEYEAALRVAQLWAAGEPDNREASLAEALAQDKLGTLDQFNNNIPAAAERYRAAADIRRRLSDRYPNDNRVQRELSISLDKLGDVDLATGNVLAARTRYEESLHLVESLPPGANPTERWVDLRFRHTRLCDACLALDDLDAADRHARSALATTRELARLDPVAGRWEVCASLERAAQVALHRGDWKGSATLRQEVLELRREILAADPQNREAVRNVQAALSVLGYSLVWARDLPAARKAYEECRVLCEAAAAADPESLQKARDMIICYDHLAVLEAVEGRYVDAAGWAGKSAEVCRQGESNPKAAHLQPGYWRLHYEHERDVYLAAARIGLDDPSRFAAEPAPITPGLWKLRALTLGWQGRADEAAAAARELRSHAVGDPEALIVAARVWALASAVVNDPARKERYAAAAVETLTGLILAHPEARHELPLNPEFVVLRGRPDYQALLRPTKPGA